MLKIAIATTDLTNRVRVQNLADQLHLPIANINSNDFAYLLVITDLGLELRQIGAKTKPLNVDFLSGESNYRRLQGGGRRQLIARAVGIKSGSSSKVLDATAGLGHDSFVLACLNCSVQMLERSPIIAALLQDGLKRLQQSPDFHDIRMELIVVDAIDYLKQLQHQPDLPDVIYLDPMFPPRAKSALVKKEMRMLQDIIGKDEDAPELLKAALACKVKRVVVKRPRLAPAISGPEPNLTFEGKSSRFDVYLSHH